jgi:H+/Cl- antiporter ClcA
MDFPWLVCLILPLGLLLIVYCTKRFASETSGSGIPQVMATLKLHNYQVAYNRLLNWKQAIWKIVLVCFALLIGLTIGREGPSVQAGAAVMLFWGYKLASRYRVPNNSLVLAGAAGGLAAAFNTPLAGIVFAMEELSKERNIRINWFVMSSILGAGFITLALQGRYEFFSILSRSDYIPPLWTVAVAALFCGGMAGLTVWGIVQWLPAVYRRYFKFPYGKVLALLFVGFVLVTLAYLSDGLTLGPGYQGAELLLNNAEGSPPIWWGITKLFAMLLSYVVGIPGGIFTPSLSIGAGFGGMFHTLLALPSDPQFMVIICMAAFLAGITQAPITSAVIVMEMTNSQEYFLSIMLAAVLAHVLSRLIHHDSLYTVSAKRFIVIFGPKSNIPLTVVKAGEAGKN